MRKELKLTRLGLMLDMGAAGILSFQPEVTLWGTGTAAKYPALNCLGWLLLFLGFGCQFAASFTEDASS